MAMGLLEDAFGLRRDGSRRGVILKPGHQAGKSVWRETALTRVERVHVEAGHLDEEARAREGRLVLLVVTDDVADVLAEEALDALVELLWPVDVLLHHAVLAVGVRRLEAQRRDLLGLDVV